MLRDGAGATEIAYNSYDPSDILKDAINKYRADGGHLNYSVTSIQTTNTTVSYTFNSNLLREVFDKVIELCPEGWYWTVTPAGIVELKPKSAIADHTFFMSKHFKSIETWRRSEDIVNRVYFTGFTTASGTGMYRVYSNSGSINSYGLHAIQKTDGRVSNDNTADAMSNRIINSRKDPEIRTVLTLLDTNGMNKYIGYDIESIVPGQTMKIKSLKEATKTGSYWNQMIWDVDVWDQTLTSAAADVIQILYTQYNVDTLQIEASSRLPEISKRIEDIERNRIQQITVDNPATPVAGT